MAQLWDALSHADHKATANNETTATAAETDDWKRLLLALPIDRNTDKPRRRLATFPPPADSDV